MSMMNPVDHVQTQMTGVTNASAPHFGPARQEHYDINWALTVPRDFTKEIWLNPEPIDRKRDGTKPAFLRPATQGHRLPALIKILQTIPLTREAMLCRESILTDYGHHGDWWDGATIQAPKVFRVGHEGYGYDIEEVLYETQRLVAFLEETERAYGSIDSVLRIAGMENLKSDEILAEFFRVWSGATKHVHLSLALHKIVESKGTKRALQGPQFEETHKFTTLQVRIDEDIADKGRTLYDAIDDILWSTDGLEAEQQDVYLEKVGDVLILDVMRPNEASSGLGIKIPAVWYLDRYLESSVVEVREMRQLKAAIQKELDEIEHRRAQMAEYRPLADDAEVIDGLSLLNMATTHFDGSGGKVKVSEPPEQQSENAASPTASSKYDIMAKELRILSEKISEKLQSNSNAAVR